jgi:organic radical activating enzyme
VSSRFIFQPYLAKLDPQIALGGGEPLLYPEIIQETAQTAHEAGLLVNFTTNGKLFDQMTDSEIYTTLYHISMISISFENYKWEDFSKPYHAVVQRIRKIMKFPFKMSENSFSPDSTAKAPLQIGCNLLLDSSMVENQMEKFLQTVSWLLCIIMVQSDMN